MRTHVCQTVSRFRCVASHWLVYQTISPVYFSRFRTQRQWHDSHSGSVVSTTAVMRFSVLTASSSEKDRLQDRRADLPGLHADAPLYFHRWHPVLTKTTWSSTTDSLFVPAVRLSTVGRCAFPVAGACIWNDLPSGISLSPFLLRFKQRLQCTYFICPIPVSHLLAVQTANCFLFVILEVAVRCLGHVKN